MALRTPLKAIRAKCLGCSCAKCLEYEVKLCTVDKCPLYEYRLGHRPPKIEKEPQGIENTTEEN